MASLVLRFADSKAWETWSLMNELTSKSKESVLELISFDKSQDVAEMLTDAFA